MTKRIRVTGPSVTRIEVSGPTVPPLDPAVVASALGAEPMPGGVEGRPGPITLYALRAELLSRRQSSGGRPGIEGTSLRAKIPLREEDWARLDSLAASLSSEGFSPSAGQVASVLLRMAIRSVVADSPPAEGRGRAALAEALAAEGERSASSLMDSGR